VGDIQGPETAAADFRLARLGDRRAGCRRDHHRRNCGELPAAVSEISHEFCAGGQIRTWSWQVQWGGVKLILKDGRELTPEQLVNKRNAAD
jgi:hypothetical protein